MNEQESLELAKKYLEDILSFFGVNVEVDAEIESDIVKLSVPGTDESSLLIGRGADNLRALQYMVSTYLRNNDAALTKVNLDIAGYKQQKAEKLAEQAKEWIEEVRRTGDTKVLHLNPADRRIVHHVASEYSDIRSFSEGEGRDRHLIIAQASS
ncbi:MAG TPA: R3H domain-containing nucleic acid-binding protein [Candidatus Saccharibacteria bacterium]|jgi:spoIIIJ-associated protein|nr:R3H domain-containing nucleic acid-binding protein [Candidatus Saccharibacteria bacterium]HMR38168.1 R3H domain-containing nucleic acid-binding protein [Candidatus Saccharibacteria bacterium]